MAATQAVTEAHPERAFAFWIPSKTENEASNLSITENMMHSRFWAKGAILAVKC